MELTTQQIKELQNKELELLDAFIQVCEQLNLKYYLLGGTLLGAVRHQGFIPWDDDIDVGMLREDYEVFLQQGQQYLPEYYFLQSFHTDSEFPANFAKLRDSRTTFVEYSMKDCRMNHGAYIDVFPLDYYPDKGEHVFRIKNLLMKLRITDAFSPGNMKLKTKALRCVSRLFYPSVKNAVDKREHLFQSVTEGKRIANHCGAWGKREIVPKQWYGEGTQLTFAGIQVWAPSHYHEWLTQVYGDYMKLPPEEKRIAHHYVAVFDLHKPYTDYLEMK